MLKQTSVALAWLTLYSGVLLGATWHFQSEVLIAIWAMSLVLYGMYGMTACIADDRDDLFSMTGMVVGVVLLTIVIMAGAYSVVMA